MEDVFLGVDDKAEKRSHLRQGCESCVGPKKNEGHESLQKYEDHAN